MAKRKLQSALKEMGQKFCSLKDFNLGWKPKVKFRISVSQKKSSKHIQVLFVQFVFISSFYAKTVPACYLWKQQKGRWMEFAKK